MKIKFKKIKWLPNELSVFPNKRGYLSYNKRAENGFMGLLAPMVGEIDIPTEETALFLNGDWYVLKGDFRKDLEKLKTIKEVRSFFIKKHKTCGSGWSTFNLAK